MNFFTLIGVELQKIRRSKISLILVIPVIMMWLPSVINSQEIFDIRDIPITPRDNFFIQGFMGMVWFMLPATLIVGTVLLIQTERTNHGMLKMLALPVNTGLLCLAKFCVLILLSLTQMLLSIAAYYASAAVAASMWDYDFFLDPLFVFRAVLTFYLGAIPMAAVFWMIATLISTPIFSIGIGLASIVPSVLMINTKAWFLYPMSYPFYLLMIEYGRAAQGVYETRIDWFPWLPTAIVITLLALGVSALRFGAHETQK